MYKRAAELKVNRKTKENESEETSEQQCGHKEATQDQESGQHSRENQTRQLSLPHM